MKWNKTHESDKHFMLYFLISFSYTVNIRAGFLNAVNCARVFGSYIRLFLHTRSHTAWIFHKLVLIKLFLASELHVSIISGRVKFSTKYSTWIFGGTFWTFENVILTNIYHKFYWRYYRDYAKKQKNLVFIVITWGKSKSKKIVELFKIC